jgi:hypothetical protein
MVQKTSLLALVVGLLVASSFVGAAAFTSATVTRDSTVGVSADTSALVGLEPGSVNGVSETSEGKLNVNLAGTATGLNIDSTFTYGDASSVSSSNAYAFKMTNGYDGKQTYTVEYKQDSSTFSDSAGSTDNLKFEFYTGDSTPLTDSTGDNVVITEGGNGQSFELTSGQTVYVVISVDTNGLVSSDDLSGQIKITA